jgi:DNA-binding protein HU-beta
MNKQELVSAVAKSTGLTKADSDKAVSAVFDAISNSLQNGESVRLVGFGTFSTAQRAARKGVNPKTGQPLQIAAKTVAKFKPGAVLAASVK